MRVVWFVRPQMSDGRSRLLLSSLVRVSGHCLPVIQQEPHHPLGCSHGPSSQLGSDGTPAREECEPVSSPRIQQLPSDRSEVDVVAVVDVQKTRAVDDNELRGRSGRLTFRTIDRGV